jgi:hypothetical protein
VGASEAADDMDIVGEALSAAPHRGQISAESVV